MVYVCGIFNCFSRGFTFVEKSELRLWRGLHLWKNRFTFVGVLVGWFTFDGVTTTPSTIDFYQTWPYAMVLNIRDGIDTALVNMSWGVYLSAFCA